MAEKVKLNPIEIEQPVDIKTTAGSVDTKALKAAMIKELSAALSSNMPETATFLRPLQKYMPKVSRGRDPGYDAARNYLLAAGEQSSYTAAKGYTKFTKFPDLIKQAVQNPVSDADKMIMQNIEQPLRKIISGFTLKPGAGASDLIKGQYTSAKKLTKLANKFAAGSGTEKDLDDAFKTVDQFQKSYRQWFRHLKSKTAEMRSTFEVRQKDFGEVKDLFKARSRVSRDHDRGAIEEAKEKIVSATLLSAAEEVKEVAKTTKGRAKKTTSAAAFAMLAEQQMTFGFGATGGRPPKIPLTAMGAGAADDGKRKKEVATQVETAHQVAKEKAKTLSPVDILNLKKAKKQDMEKDIGDMAGKLSGFVTGMQPGKLGANFGTLFMNGISRVIVGGLQYGSMAALGVGFAAMGAAVIGGFVAAIGMGAGAITKALADPIIKGFKMGFDRAGDSVRAMQLAMYPLIARGRGVASAFKDVAAPILQLGASQVPLEVMAKLEQRFVRIKGSAGGLQDYLKGILNYSALTGEEVSSIDDSFLEIATFFGFNLDRGAAKLVQHMTNVALATNATSQEIRTISQWLMPAFASTVGDAEDKFKGVLTMSGKLAEVGLKQPRQLVQFTSALEQFQTPGTNELGLIAALSRGAELFVGGSGNFQRRLIEVRDTMEDLVKQETDILNDTSLEYTARTALVEPLRQQKQVLTEELSDLFQIASGEGMKPASVEKQVEILGEALESNGVWAASASRVIKGSLISSIREMLKALREPLNVAGAADKATAALSDDLGLLQAKAKNAYDTFFKFAGITLFAPMQKEAAGGLISIFDNLNKQFATFVNLPDKAKGVDSSVFGAMYNMGKNLAGIFTDYLNPAIKDFSNYLQAVFVGDKGGMQKYGAHLKQEIAGAITAITTLIAPVTEKLSEMLISVFVMAVNAIAENLPLFGKITEKFVEAFKGALKKIAADAEWGSIFKSLGWLVGSGIKAAILGQEMPGTEKAPKTNVPVGERGLSLANAAGKGATLGGLTPLGSAGGAAVGIWAAALRMIFGNAGTTATAIPSAEATALSQASDSLTDLVTLLKARSGTSISGLSTSLGDVGVTSIGDGMVSVLDKGQRTTMNLQYFLEKYFMVTSEAVEQIIESGSYSAEKMQAATRGM